MLKKLGLFLLDWALASVWPKILSAIQSWWSKLKREKDQKRKTDQINDDVAKERIRDDETRKNEEDFLNS